MEILMVKSNSTLSAGKLRIGLLSILLVLAVVTAVHAQSSPTFSKVFAPNTIGPGSTSTLTFTITNGSATPVTGLAFTDTLPAAVTIADPANASTDCDLGLSGSLSAPDGGSTISLSGAQLGGSQSCTVTVDVTASTPGSHTNTSGDLISSAGNSGTASDDLIVATDRPGFSKSFAPSSVPLGDRSTLTFTIDNTLNASRVGSLDFTDNLPAGMLVADPANASTDCISAGSPETTITAAPGTSVITLDANGTAIVAGFEVLPIGATCTVTVDVTGTGTGMLDNMSDNLLADFVSAGKASATLDVTVTDLAIQKSFTDDPVPPGGTVTLDFTLDNFDRDFSATGVAFTDDLALALSGLTFSTLLANDCGGSVTGVGTTTIGLTGGTVPAQGFCTISTSLTVPSGATPGVYTNTTSAITGTVDGSPVVGNMASDDLFVEPVPLLTKEFLEDGTLAPDPVINAGDDVVLRFTITNTSTTSMATDITFGDELTDGGPLTGFLPFPVTVALPPTPDPPCGAGSSLALVSFGTDRQGLLLTGGSLAAAPGAGSTCTFEVTVTIPATLAPGVYVNTTEEITATVDGATRIGEPASDDLTVIAAPQLTKSFTDDPVDPSGTVTLEFTLTYPPDASGAATGITFTDDLSFLSGLTANLPPTPDPPCGAGSTLTGSAGNTLLTFMGGALSPGESCTFSVTLDVPAGAAAGNHTNTTSGVGATVDGLAATSPPASDDLAIQGLVFTKEFVGDPVIPGDTATLRFTIENVHPTAAATSITFTDDLSLVLPGASDLTPTLPPAVNTCGGSLSTIGPTFLSYNGGSLTVGSTCTIDVEVLVPAGTADGTYVNTTSGLSTSLGTIDPAVDTLTIDSNLLQLTKAFTDDPVAPGGTVTLEFTLTNLDAGQAASAIGFSDNLGAALASLTFDSVQLDTCGGTVTGTGTDMITVSGVFLAAGGSCTLRVSLTVPGAAAANLYTNTTSAVTSTIGGFAITGDAASDVLEVVQLLQFSKSFDGPTTATGMATLTFTITNPGADTATDISFSDDLDAVITGLVATSLPALPCGAGSSLTGVSFLTFTGGELPPMGGTCSFDVDVLVPGTTTAGTFPNTTSDLLRAGLKVADPATADLTIEPPPAFAKSFAPSAILQGGTSTLTFTIDNTASALAASSLDVTDNLPVEVVIADPPNASTTCTGGTLTTVSGTSTITYTGGTVSAGASCTVTVDVTSTTSGAHVNTTGDLTSSAGNSGTASATLDVLASSPAITLSKTPASQVVVTGGTAGFTLTVTNTGDVELTNVTVGDPLAPDCDRALGTLAVGAMFSYDCTLSGVSADFTNDAMVSGDPPVGAPVTASASAVVDVIGPAIVTSLQMGDKIAGNAVALAAFEAPLNTVEVLFQYRPLGTTDWVDIGPATVPPFFIVTWNTLVVPDGAVELRAQPKLDDGTTLTTAPIQVTVDNSGTASGITVFGDESGHIAMVSASEDSTVVTSQGVIIEIPAGTLDADDTIIVNVIQPQDASGTPPGDPAALLTDITLASGQDTFANPLTIRMAYADEDQDGVVDGTSIAENTLTLWFFDDDTESWVTVMGAVVRPDANVVEGMVTHLTEFGLFEAPLPGTTLQVTVGTESPEPDVRVTMTRVSRAVPVLHVQLDPEAETCRLTNVTLVFTNPKGKAKAAKEFFVDLLNDANGDGMADPDEDVLATAEIMDIRDVLPLTLDPPLALTPGTTVHLLFTLTGPRAPAALTQQSVLPIPQSLLPVLGLVVGASTVLGLFMAWRRRRGFSVLLIVCMVGWSFILTSCDGDENKVTFTVTLPANGLQCEGDLTGPFSVPAAPLVGAKVTIRR